MSTGKGIVLAALIGGTIWLAGKDKHDDAFFFFALFLLTALLAS